MSDFEDSEDRNCIVLRHNFDELIARDYYFWDTVSCDSKQNYICQLPPKDIGCQNGNGRNYTGTANVTQDGTSCIKWNDPQVLRTGTTFDQQQTWNHNFCRNPDGDTSPWCMIGAKQYAPCDIPDCSIMEQNKISETCEPDELKCGDSPK